MWSACTNRRWFRTYVLKHHTVTAYISWDRSLEIPSAVWGAEISDEIPTANMRMVPYWTPSSQLSQLHLSTQTSHYLIRGNINQKIAWGHFLKHFIFEFFMHMDVLHHIYAVSTEARRRYQILKDESYRDWATIRVLGIIPARGLLTAEPYISSAPWSLFSIINWYRRAKSTLGSAVPRKKSLVYTEKAIEQGRGSKSKSNVLQYLPWFL